MAGEGDNSGGGGVEPAIEATPENFAAMMADPEFKGFGDDDEPANDNDKPAVAVADAPASDSDGDVEHDRGEPPGAVEESEEADEPQEFEDDEPESEETDDSDELHGLKAADVLAALRDGKVPPELLEHVQVPVKIRGEESLVSAKEAAAGYQRQVDYSRRSADLLGRESELKNAKAAFDGLLDGWSAKEKVADTVKQMRRLGLPVREIATFIAQEHVEDLNLSEEARAYKRKLRELEDKLEGQQERQDLELSGREDYELEARKKQAQGVYNAALPGALKAAGLPDSQRVRGMVTDHLRNLWSDGELTGELVQAAVQATSEELADLAGVKKQAQPAPKPKAPALPVRREGASRTAPKPQGGRSPRTVEPTIENFRAHVAKLAARRR